MSDGAAIVPAAAKLTVELHVTGVRDDGYHLIDAEMITLDIADELTIVPAAAISLEVTGPFAAGVPTDGRNLVWRALECVERPAAVTLDKRMPSGGGLGGGSADAAAVLRWAGVDDLDVAVGLGADVPFCLVGGRARVGGIGEVVEPLPPQPLTVTLIVPPLHVSTPAVYAAWDALGADDPARSDERNDLTAAAMLVEPRLVHWQERIADCCGVMPTLAGSGATWFVEGEHEDALAPVQNEGATVVVARAA